jgi:hypothetical protein
MAEFKRNVRQNAAEITLRDGNGKIVRNVRFNPQDIRGRKIFAECAKRADLLEEKLENMEDGADKLIVLVDELDAILASMDKVFGPGTTDCITEGYLDEVAFENLRKFFEVARPFYDAAEKAQQGRVAPYMADNAHAIANE